MNSSCHDIIIADFGRSGTLRYLKLFSELEKRYITTNYSVNEFYDEMRCISYVLVGKLREIKKDFLPKNINRINEHQLMGIKDGIHYESLIQPIVNILNPFLKIAIEEGFQKIRIIFPCNSMYFIANYIKNNIEKLKSGRSKDHENVDINLKWLLPYLRFVQIQVPQIANYYLKSRFDKHSEDKLYFIGSGLAMEGYKDSIKRNGFKISIEALSGDHSSFIDILHSTLNQKPIEYISTGHTLINGCTDFYIPNADDPLKKFVINLVDEAYKEGGK